MVVVGEREAASRQVSLRLLRGEKSQVISVEELLARAKAEPLPS
jgi:threonyl-tRNA synthetase